MGDMTVNEFSNLLNICQGRTAPAIEYALVTFYNKDLETLSRALKCGNSAREIAQRLLQLS